MSDEFKLTALDFFGAIFINSYVFALKEGNGGQTNGSIPTLHCGSELEINEFFEKQYFELNKNGYGIHFTPNGIVDLKEKNRKHNISHINAWYLDIDIDDSKKIRDEADKMCREETKERILAKIFMIDVRPSLTVETRNGFHLYWFANGDATIEKFDLIQGKLLFLFKEFGGDSAACGIMHSLRVPYFKYYKNGEEGFITPIGSFSSLALHSEESMLKWLAGFPSLLPKNKSIRLQNRDKIDLQTGEIYKINTFRNNRHGIFARAENKDIIKMLEKLSGTVHVNGDIFSLVRVSENRMNVLANGASTPNWVDTKQNKIFSNNEPGFCVIHHFLKWYGHDNKKLALIYHEMGL